MAATSSKLSPSSKPVLDGRDLTASSGDNLKSAPVSSVVVVLEVENITSNEQSLVTNEFSDFEPTYFTSESSRWYTIGKSLLDDGDFEAALRTIEEGIECTRSMILRQSELKRTGKDVNDATIDDEDYDLHESMAPLHYLYGTTLLYSIEESDENQAMTFGGTTPATDTLIDDVNTDPEVDAEDYQPDAANGNEDADHGQQDDNQPLSEEVAEDLEIAWENLDLARTIMENMLNKPDSFDNTMLLKVKADLAQVYLREGDLQRTNSKYSNAISDYEKSLQLLNITGMTRNERKIADVHYNLGLTNFMLVAASKASTDINDEESEMKNQQEEDPIKTQESIIFARGKGFFHFVTCAMTLGGILAGYCQIDPVEFIKNVHSDVPNMKRGDDDEPEMENPTVASTKVSILRKKLSTLTPDENVKDKFDDFISLLDEIQETIDEAESSEQGVQEVTAMKEQIASAVAMQTVESEENTSPFATTAVGFDSVASTTAASHTNIITSTAVRKKAKRVPDTENDSSKRCKTE